MSKKLNVNTMTDEEFNAYTYGMWIASLICEERAGRRSSDNAMAIMAAHRKAELEREKAQRELATVKKFDLSDFVSGRLSNA